MNSVHTSGARAIGVHGTGILRFYALSYDPPFSMINVLTEEKCTFRVICHDGDWLRQRCGHCLIVR